MRIGVVFLGAVLAGSATAQQCEQAEWPSCAFIHDTFFNQTSLAACQASMDQKFAANEEYRDCLRDHRDDVVWDTDLKLMEVAAEMGAFATYMSCVLASKSADDVSRCPVPPFFEGDQASATSP